jgi:hypothetical protein
MAATAVPGRMICAKKSYGSMPEAARVEKPYRFLSYEQVEKR